MADGISSVTSHTQTHALPDSAAPAAEPSPRRATARSTEHLGGLGELPRGGGGRAPRMGRQSLGQNAMMAQSLASTKADNAANLHFSRQMAQENMMMQMQMAQINAQQEQVKRMAQLVTDGAKNVTAAAKGQ